MNYELTQHADVAMRERGIPLEWLERVLQAPELKQADPADDTIERLYRKIPEHGNRVLRAVVNTTTVPERVVSVYFDRGMKGRL